MITERCKQKTGDWGAICLQCEGQEQELHWLVRYIAVSSRLAVTSFGDLSCRAATVETYQPRIRG